jgi:cyclopropane-fatty-acyl-phospholipid synthase
MSGAEKTIRKLLAGTGVEINGPNPWDIKVKDQRFFSRVLSGGSLAAGESYMDGWWECEDLAGAVDRLLRAEVHRKAPIGFEAALYFALSRLTNMQTREQAFEVGERHYDVGNDLYEKMLDKRMAYTCGYWKDAKNLDEAQEAKLDLVCRKIGLERGMSVLDIGCGWASFAKFAAEKYGAVVTGVTVSKEQVEHVCTQCAGLPITACLQDYRTIEGKFDRVVSLGMFEHVGYKNYREYMQKVRDLLKDDGLFLLHTIGGNRSVYASDPWFHKYIFPNGMLPSIAQVGSSIENLFVMEDWHNFGYDYSRTLEAWYANFEAAWPQLKDTYGERFYRMWRYYLLTMVGSFRSRKSNQLWQIVLSPNGVSGGYRSVR